MNKKLFLKSIIGTVGIYLFLIAFVFILSNFLDALVYLPIYEGVLIACSIAAGLLFKGQIYAWVWTAATVIIFVVICAAPSGWDFESIIAGVGLFLVPLLIPFLIVKSVFVSIKLQEKS
ncbi:MAG: hypothetical protein K2J80_03385 [Oscillospiraceae bacterium]|nr:hypothetical protein [Oscillospiraceae bacterium]